MPRPGPRKRNPTKLDREADKETARTLLFQGHSQTEIAEILGHPLSTVKTWIQEGQWVQQLTAAQKLVPKSRQDSSPAGRVLFDRVKTGRRTRNFLSKAAFRMAREVAHQAKADPLSMFEDNATNFKQLVEASAKIDGSWDDQQGSKFAVSLNLNQYVQSGQIREVPPGWTVEEA